MAGKVKLYGFNGSNSVYTGRLLLEHKGVDYSFVKLPPAAHAFILLARGFDTMAVPALKVGRVRVQGTRWIARALDELYPEKPLFPADPEQRRAVQAAERWGEELQNALRRIFYCACRRDRSAFIGIMGAEKGPVGRTLLRTYSPIVIRLATGVHRATDPHGREDVELLPERLDQIDAWIAEGVLDGPELNAADYQIAVNVAGFMLCEDFAPYIAGRPAERHARRVAPDYAGHIGAIVPDEWMAPLRAGNGVPTATPSVLRTSGYDDDQIATLTRERST
ncbi:MAG: glutathione S-transferase family protein [Solirubrobacteraceae bacterium]